LSIFASRAASAIENAQLYQRLQQTLQETIQGLVTALEAKDRYTSGHTKRVTEYAIMTARGLDFNREDTEKIRRAALLHDIGKIGVHMEALNKVEKLSAKEYEAFKQHPRQSRLILEPIQFLRDIIPIVEAHHERWDGQGYPNGLKGEDIPLGARILAIADSFDAMTSDRPYRKALSRQMAVKELREKAGSQFDPDLVEVFIRELHKSG
jgi:putative nucleotidyltransferase with HDIG domain